MPDDLDPWDAEDFFNEDDADEEQSGHHADDGDPDAAPIPSEPDEDAPSPGERLLFALGQLYRLHRHDGLDVRPKDFDVWDLARIIGVRNDIEFISEGPRSSHWHFAAEVLHIDETADFPWRLLSMWEWAAEREGEVPEDEVGRE